MARRQGRTFKLTSRQQRTMKKLKIDYAPLAYYRQLKLPDGAVVGAGRHRDRRRFLVFRDGTAKKWNGRPFQKTTWKIG